MWFKLRFGFFFLPDYEVFLRQLKKRKEKKINIQLQFEHQKHVMHFSPLPVNTPVILKVNKEFILMREL